MDLNTGEIKEYLYHGDHAKITRAEQDEYKETHVLRFKRNSGFFKLFDGATEALSQILQPCEFSFVLRLIEYVGFDNRIRDSDTLLSIADISQRLNISKNMVYQIVPQLIKKGILAKKTENEKCFLFNPYIGVRGRDVRKDTLKFFVNSGWKERLSGIKARYKIPRS